MDVMMSTHNFVICSGLLIIALGFWAYRKSLPRPFKDIPFNKEAGVRPFGDIPEIIAAPDPLSFFLKRSHELQSPIFQVFLEPFGRPSIVITDARESHDILARRSREFDRAKFFADLFIALAPNNQVVMPTNDQWHSNRRLMADTMSPSFLANSAAPQVQAAFTTFIELWRLRAGLAKGRPFDAEHDIDTAMMDAITAVAFGSSSHATEVERDFIASTSNVLVEKYLEGHTTIVEFSRTPPPPEHTAIEKIAASAQIAGDSPLGAWHHWFALKFYPSLRTAQKVRHKVITRQIRVAFERFSNPESAGDDIKSAADLIVSREIAMAKKEQRKLRLSDPIIDDELFGFVIAGYDTTATTIKWGVKFLAKHPEVQSKLRSELRAAFLDHADSPTGSLPTAEDIAKHRPAYLDACIEEILRLGNPGVSPIRTSTVDTVVMGHAIPKGTDVIMLSVGPSHTEPSLYVDEKTRNKSCQESIDSAYTGKWDPQTLGHFMPERWLAKNANTGQVEFDPRAGSQQTFGGGLRGCFGRRLAYIILRMVFTMIVWEFELLSLPEDLGTFANKVILTNTPVKCYVKLRTIDHAKQ